MKVKMKIEKGGYPKHLHHHILPHWAHDKEGMVIKVRVKGGLPPHGHTYMWMPFSLLHELKLIPKNFEEWGHDQQIEFANKQMDGKKLNFNYWGKPLKDPATKQEKVETHKKRPWWLPNFSRNKHKTAYQTA